LRLIESGVLSVSNVVVPQLGESVVEARVGKWLKKVGDSVSPGEPLVELETDKIDLEVGAEQRRIVEAILEPVLERGVSHAG
jgi:2-oxoglutarate dehydrogenase E2 component (dihydrolipoamide succinyltransferase)